MLVRTAELYVQKKSLEPSPGTDGYEQKRTPFVLLLSPSKNAAPSAVGHTEHPGVDEALAARAAAFATAAKGARRNREGDKTSDGEHDDCSTERKSRWSQIWEDPGRSGFSRVFNY